MTRRQGRKEWCVHMMYIIWMMHYKEMRNKNCTNLFCNTAQPICMSIRAASRSVWAAWQVLPYFVGSVVLKIENLVLRVVAWLDRNGRILRYLSVPCLLRVCQGDRDLRCRTRGVGCTCTVPPPPRVVVMHSGMTHISDILILRLLEWVDI